MAKKGKSGSKGKGYKPPTKLSSIGKGSSIVSGMPGHCDQPAGKRTIPGGGGKRGK